MTEEEFFVRKLVPADLDGLTVYEKAAVYYLQSKGQDPFKEYAKEIRDVKLYQVYNETLENLDKQLTALERAKHRG